MTGWGDGKPINWDRLVAVATLIILGVLFGYAAIH